MERHSDHVQEVTSSIQWKTYWLVMPAPWKVGIIPDHLSPVWLKTIKILENHHQHVSIYIYIDVYMSYIHMWIISCILTKVNIVNMKKMWQAHFPSSTACRMKLIAPVCQHQRAARPLKISCRATPDAQGRRAPNLPEVGEKLGILLGWVLPK